MLIGFNGEKFGLLPFSKALESAKSASLDLVQVSPSDANPVVCKLLDYGIMDKSPNPFLEFEISAVNGYVLTMRCE